MVTCQKKQDKKETTPKKKGNRSDCLDFVATDCIAEYNPWPEVMLSSDIEATIVEEKQLRYKGPPLLPPGEPLFEGYALPPEPKNPTRNEYSPLKAAMYLNCLDDGEPRGSPANRR